MKKRNRYFVIVLVAALLLTVADTGLGRKKADAAGETSAYLEFLDNWWGFTGASYKSSYDNIPASKVTAEEATVNGDGVYRLSVDFAKTDDGIAHGIANCTIRIPDGEQLYGSTSYIQIRSVTITNSNGDKEPLENIDSNYGYTYADGKGQTSFCLFSTQIPWTWTWDGKSENNIREISGVEVTQDSAQDVANYQLLREWNDSTKGIQKIEVIFAFAENAAALAEIPADATPKPHTSTTPESTASTTPSESPEAMASVSPSATPSAIPQATASSNPGTSIAPSPTKTPQNTITPNPGGTGKPTATPQSSVTPSGAPGSSGNIASNSTYTGEEKIFVNKSAIVVAAGSHASVTIALLRGASSATQVTASSGDSGIAVPTLQPDGKLDIAVSAGAPAGRSTTITLRFGNSSASVTVTVSNPVTQLKGAKKSYKIKRKKTTKVSVKLTPKNTSYATTDAVTASISKKKVASVSSVKVSGNKATIKVKALKKGTAKLKVKAGGKSASITIKVK